MVMSRQERGRRRGAANKGSVKAPRALLDMRLVWKKGVAEGEGEAAILGTLRPHQQTLYRILKDDPKGFQKTMAEEEVRLRKRVEEKKAARAEKGGVDGGATGTIPAESQHGKVEGLIGGLLGEWEGKGGEKS